jgi:hypothetical protein
MDKTTNRISRHKKGALDCLPGACRVKWPFINPSGAERLGLTERRGALIMTIFFCFSILIIIIIITIGFGSRPVKRRNSTNCHHLPASAQQLANDFPFCISKCFPFNQKDQKQWKTFDRARNQGHPGHVYR